MPDDFPLAEKARTFEQVSSLLGGRGVLNPQPTTRLEIHELILRGLPTRALTCLVDGVELLRQPAAVEKALGFSFRTLQRRKQAATKPLSLEQSSRVWEFAEILARATSVLGSRDEAQEWMLRPDTALEQRRPLDMMATSEGRKM